MSESEWKMPRVRPGDRVLIARNPAELNMETAVPAIVTQISGDTLDATLITTGGPVPCLSVRHIGDPAIVRCPDMLEEPNTGVFVLHPAEVELADLRFAVDSLIERVARSGTRTPGSPTPPPQIEIDVPEQVPEFETTKLIPAEKKIGRPKGSKSKPK